MDMLAGVLRLLAGLTLGSTAGAAQPLALAALVGAAAAVAIVAAAQVVLLVSAPATRAHTMAPRQDADLAVRVVQSDPDADGHVRARAPGRRSPTVRAAASV